MLKKKPLAGKKKPVPVKKRKKKSFPIVAIGASAGGLKAFSALLQNLSPKTGMAFIYVQHLSPDHKSVLPEILSKKTKMKVRTVGDMALMKPDTIYVIPVNKGIKVTDGHIKLVPRSLGGPAVSIDVLFTSLAITHKENVIGVILSGNAKDGTVGIEAIKKAGGLTIAQDSTAENKSMPRSAIASGYVDLVLSPRRIAQWLNKLDKKNFFSNLPSKNNHRAKPIKDDDTHFKVILQLLHKETGIDFSHYKTDSIKRRMSHTMAISGVQTTRDYVKLLRKKNDEVGLLCKDILINVTGFFRDKEVFKYLRSVFFPKLLKSKKRGETIRIWVPACSTGQEVYSLAILISELQASNARKIPVQIFATDLSEEAIRHARLGEYSESEMETVSRERIKSFFIKTGDRYCIAKELREICVFAPHNILSDPPFFRMDFISCRNLLIYFDSTAQKKALATMHFALNEGKYLMLGKSESIGISSHLFTQTNSKFRIYSRKKDRGARKMPELIPRYPGSSVRKKESPLLAKKGRNFDFTELDSAINSVLLSQYMPACVVINKDMEILQFRGLTSLYLAHPSGKASLNILKMLRPEFDFELRSAIHLVIKTNQVVRRSDIELKVGTEFRKMSFEVAPLKLEWDEPLFLIVFTLHELIEKSAESHGLHKGSPAKSNQRVKTLMKELGTARDEMHSVIESQETAYEELQTSNEEIVSSNEEFQTLNEELETSKEELEATNEELISTNLELKTQNELLAESYNYSQTIIATIHEPMIVLDSSLKIKSANRSFYKKFHVTKEETEGMFLFKLGNKQWDIPQLRQLFKDIFTKKIDFNDFEVKHTFPGIGEKVMLLNANRIIQKAHQEQLILLAIEDITERSSHYLKEKEMLHKDIRGHQEEKLELEKAVRRRTRQIEQKNIELENANKDLTSFIYVSSHDLQEPLRKIRNFTSILLNEETRRLSEDGKKYLKRTFETAKRMQTLIEDLLTFSRIKYAERKFERTDLNMIVKEAKKEFEELIKEKKAVIKFGKLCKVSIIRFQFRQLFCNLISNSLKFAKPGIVPRITIKSKVVPGKKIASEKLSVKLNYCHITYTDNGIGFDQQYSERIFEVFQRLHGQEEYKGTGMGLAICKRIVENHQGLITATGTLNKGARFDIYVPVL